MEQELVRGKGQPSDRCGAKVPQPVGERMVPGLAPSSAYSTCGGWCQHVGQSPFIEFRTELALGNRSAKFLVLASNRIHQITNRNPLATRAECAKCSFDGS